MRTPYFSAFQFVDPTLMNGAVSTVSGAIAMDARTSLPAPGLVFPENCSFTVNGYLVTAVLPSPFCIVNASGVIGDAHGVLSGQDTQTYSVTFSGLVPSVGSVTAYLVAQFTTIQQIPVPIAGPPPGHPSYNPNFVPTTGYGVTLDTFNIVPSLTAPDNATQFELGRCTLTAGATGLSGFTVQYQKRAAHYKGWPLNQISASSSITQSAALYLNQAIVGPIITTLPLANPSAGLVFRFVNASSGVWTISANVNSTIFAPWGSNSTLQIAPSGATALWCDGSNWYTEAIVGMVPLASRPSVVSLPVTVGVANYGAMLETTNSGTLTLDAAGQNIPKGFNLAIWVSSGGPIAVTCADSARLFGPGSIMQGASSINLNNNDFLNLTYDGFNWIVRGASPWLLRNQGTVVYDTNGTFTVPPNVTSVKVTVVGGGGGGAGCQPGAGGTGTFISGGGGGAGGYARKRIAGLSPGSTIAVTVGAGGGGIVAGGTAGTGGTSSFGSYCSATGGAGGTSGASTSPGGGPGQGSGGDENGVGGWGSDGQGGATNVIGFGNGGASLFGGGMRAGAGAGGGTNASAPGSGGGGAYGNTGTGFNGIGGRVIVEWEV